MLIYYLCRVICSGGYHARKEIWKCTYLPCNSFCRICFNWDGLTNFTYYCVKCKSIFCLTHYIHHLYALKQANKLKFACSKKTLVIRNGDIELLGLSSIKRMIMHSSVENLTFSVKGRVNDLFISKIIRSHNNISKLVINPIKKEFITHKEILLLSDSFKFSKTLILLGLFYEQIFLLMA